MAILRQQRRRSNFTVVDNDLITDSSLSWAARGMLVYLLAKPDGWEVREQQLVGASSAPRQGIATVRQIMAELEYRGYVRRGWEHGERGRLVRTTEIADFPMFSGVATSELTDVGLTDIGGTDIGKAEAIVRTDSKQELSEARTEVATVPAPSAPAPDVAPLRLAILAWLGLGNGEGAPAGVFVQVSSFVQVYLNAGESVADIEEDARSWFAQDWRGRKGQAPSCYQAREWRAKRRAGSTNGHVRPGAHTEPATVHVMATPEQLAAARAKLAEMGVNGVRAG